MLYSSTSKSNCSFISESTFSASGVGRVLDLPVWYSTYDDEIYLSTSILMTLFFIKNYSVPISFVKNNFKILSGS